MVSKEMPLYKGCSARKASSRSLTDISVCPPASTAGLNHLRNFTIATPSRVIARR